jgi:hypothetical protein
MVVFIVAKALSLAVVAFGLIASGVCGLLGPIFAPFFIVPKLDLLHFSAVAEYTGHLHQGWQRRGEARDDAQCRVE